MKKVIKETEVKVIQKEVIYLCDKCNCEIDNPNTFGNKYNYITLDSDLNYPEHGGWENKFELCEDCYEILETQITNFINE